MSSPFTFRFTFILSLLCLSYVQILAQTERVKLNGTVQDNQKKPVPFGNVALFNSADSTLAGGNTTNENGRFTIDAKPGSYYIKISYLAMEEKVISGIRLSDKNIELGTIVLKANTKLLNEVVVKGEKSQMELQLDKRVFNVGKDLSNIGGNASEILNNVPSITVDVEGNVALRGSGNVRILIDGKPSGLIGINPAEALRQIPGDLIESIEVITNPSSRYDAEGEVGIINIVMKKNNRQGLNGSFMATTGHPANHGGSFNVNYRKDKINFISSFGLAYRTGPGRGSSRQQYTSADTSFVYEQKSNRDRASLGTTAMVGADYYLNDRNILTGTVAYRHGKGLNKNRLEYRDFDENNELTQTIVRTERETEPRNNFEGALSYRKTFAKKGRSFSIDTKWIVSEELELADFVETTADVSRPIIQRSSNTENERNALIQMDYVHPFSKDGKFEAGLKSTFRTLHNDFSVEQQNTAAGWDLLPAFDNNLLYDEKIHAAYLMASNKFGNFFIQGGLRGELSDIKTELVKTNEVNPRKYFNVFPSLHLSYKLNDLQTLQLSYSYRLSRPGFRDLLPFSNFSDSRVFRAGNPDLNPEYTHSYEAGHLLNMEKGSLLTSIYYRRRNGVIEQITTVDSTGFTRIRPINLSAGNSYGFEFNFSYDLASWWKWNVSANFFKAESNGRYNDVVLHAETFTWTSRASSRMTVFKGVDFQAAINYRAPRKTTQGRELASYAIDLGLSKDLLKGKATVTAGVKDLLNTQRRRSIVESAGYYSNSDFLWRARQIVVTVSYRLNRAKEKNSEGNRGGGEGGGEEY